MKRVTYLIPALLMLALLSGCATMSKNECLNANWETVGYSDGSRGVHYTHLDKYRQSCVEHNVVPDDAAYRHGWEQGIRRYCTADNGYRAGQRGQPYRNICPVDVKNEFISGWQRGVRLYCTSENGLRHGLAGHRYNGICPTDLEYAFRDFYQLGLDVRTARAEHRKLERSVIRLEKQLVSEKRTDQHRKMLFQLERLQHRAAHSGAKLNALEACMHGDWFDAGYRDGEDGYPRRAGEIASVCRNYGIAPDRRGYRKGWDQGKRHYCTYDNGLYLGQTNQPYSGVCAGIGHQHFWHGYERGRMIYRSERYEAHPKPAKRTVHRPAQKVHKLPPHIKQEKRNVPKRKHTQTPVNKTVKAVHDNRDKLKHPMPEQSRKGGSKEEEQQGDDDHKK